MRQQGHKPLQISAGVIMEHNHDPTVTMLLKLPLSLKEALTLHATNHNMSVSHAVRLAVTKELGLPIIQANMSGPRQPTTTNTQRRRKARRIQRQLATLAPEVITYLLEQETSKE